jgi:type IX secretion system PorP/SprF family membrane protein
MKKILIFSFVIAWFSAFSQQENQYTQFMHTKLLFNPAFAGAREVNSVSALYRQQWMGFEGAPVSQLVSFDAPLKSKRVGLGVNLHHHTIGQVNDNYMVNLAYSYSLVRTDDVNVKFGIGATFRHYRLELTSLNTGNLVADPAQLQPNANTLNNGNIGAGLYFTFKDFYIGLSVPNIYRNQLGTGSATINAESKPHFYGMAGGLFPLTDNIDLKPSAIVKYAQNSPFSADANLSFVFNKKFNIGASYRTGYSAKGESIDGLMFFQINPKFGIGAAYDYNISDLRSYQNGSFEALIRYDFSAKDRDVITNPRFFF